MAPSGASAPPIPPPGSPGAMGHPTGPSMPQSPPGQHPPHGFPMQPPIPSGQPPPFQPNINPQMNMQRPPFPPIPDLQMLQSLFPFPSLGQNPVEMFSSFLRNQAMGQQGDPSLAFIQNLQQQMGAEVTVAVFTTSSTESHLFTPDTAATTTRVTPTRE
ncbi:hypothetical protein E3U43_009982 [Larimichthys crocea]|uniref:Uncharacterized protein n=1 Tax=Larimichthys crocea TaxID=215358 RepID=A0ACD3QCA1_LARCR|nr:hypothetical protein E3U43_009982 [Larimichthys crocea]